MNNCTTKHFWNAFSYFSLEPVCIIPKALEATSGTSQSSRKKQTAKDSSVNGALNNCATKHFCNAFNLEPVCIIPKVLEATSGTSQSSGKKQTAKDSSVNGALKGSKLLS